MFDTLSINHSWAFIMQSIHDAENHPLVKQARQFEHENFAGSAFIYQEDKDAYLSIVDSLMTIANQSLDINCRKNPKELSLESKLRRVLK